MITRPWREALKIILEGFHKHSLVMEEKVIEHIHIPEPDNRVGTDFGEWVCAGRMRVVNVVVSTT
jgi:hypothetical protein